MKYLILQNIWISPQIVYTHIIFAKEYLRLTFTTDEKFQLNVDQLLRILHFLRFQSPNHFKGHIGEKVADYVIIFIHTSVRIKIIKHYNTLLPCVLVAKCWLNEDELQYWLRFDKLLLLILNLIASGKCSKPTICCS